jgi:hypothetical protein
MRARISRNVFQTRLRATFSDHRAIRSALGDAIPGFADPLNNWLARLKLLYGVPFNYLVPDEGMLPPESIRFFIWTSTGSTPCSTALSASAAI